MIVKILMYHVDCQWFRNKNCLRLAATKAVFKGNYFTDL